MLLYKSVDNTGKYSIKHSTAAICEFAEGFMNPQLKDGRLISVLGKLLNILSNLI